MADFRAKIQTAREAGYSNEEIQRYLMSQPEAAKARDAGYSDDEIAAHFGLSAPSDEGKFRFASKETEQAGVGAIGRAAQAVEDYFTKPVAPAPANLQAQGYDPLAAYAERTIGNVPRDVTNIAGGFTPEGLGSAYSAVTERPFETAAGLVGGAYGAIRHPLETFAESPVSFGMGLAAAPSTVNALMAARRIPSMITRPEAALAPALRAETEAAKKGAYKALKESPARYDSESYASFLDDAKQGLSELDYDPMAKGTYKNMTKVLNTLDNYRDSTLDMKAVKNIRKEIGTLYKKGTDAEKLLATELTNRFDKFWENPSNAAVGFEADVEAAAPELRKGIDATRELFQDRVISSMVNKANAAPDFANSLQKQFTKIADDSRKLDRFTPEQQTIIREIAEGRTSSPWVDQLASLAPGLRNRKLTTTGEAILAYSHPYIAGGLAFAGKGAQMATERGARQAVNRLAQKTFKSKNAMAR